jgi:hypothetical protein
MNLKPYLWKIQKQLSRINSTLRNNNLTESGGGGGDVWVIKAVEKYHHKNPEWVEYSISTGGTFNPFIYTTDPTLGALAPGFIDNLGGTFAEAEWIGNSFWIELATFSADQTDCLTAFGGDITPQVHTFTATNVLDTSAVLNWKGSGNLWNVEYGPAGFTPGTGTLVSGIEKQFVQIAGLTDTTAYEYYVQGECGGSTSSFAGPGGAFTTIAPLNTCDYTINMFDAYGDGWNGASIDVDVAGVVTNVGLPDPAASLGIAFVPSLNGDNVTFTFNPGSYDSEVTFNILDPSGTSLGSYGPSPAVGLFLTDVSNSTCT